MGSGVFGVIGLLSLLTVASVQGEPVAQLQPQPQPESAQVLVLSPRSSRAARAQVKLLTQGLQRAVLDTQLGLKTETDLAGATPGDIVARCPARISGSCLANAARKTGAQLSLTGSVEKNGAVVSVLLKVIDVDKTNIVALRDVNLVPARGDTLDMDLAGLCLGRSLLDEALRRPERSGVAPCASRVFASSSRDVGFYQQQGAPSAQQWLTVLPPVAVRQAYEKRNAVIAGSFASAGAVAIVGLTTAGFLAAQAWLTHTELRNLAEENPASFVVQGDKVWVVDAASEAAGQYRSMQARERMETLTSTGAGLGALLAAVVGLALYEQAEIPGRYEAYLDAPAPGEIVQ